MIRSFAKTVIIAFAAASAFAAAPCQAAGAGDYKPGMAPLNPAFLQYLETLKAPAARAAFKTRSGHGLGAIPAPMIAAAASPFSPGVNGSYPLSYDLRSHNKVTPVKDQGSTCGDCWAFSAMGSMESYFMPSETLDFSEADLNANSGFDVGSCNGGNDYMSAAYMTRWSGPLVATSSTPVKHAQNLIFLSPRGSATDNDRIKNAVETYGGLSVSFYYDDSFYNAATSSYYASTSSASNHQVTIVGWDDNYAKANFSAVPAGNGAFLCKNSWGTSWGLSGYFYVSYYDSVFGRDSYVTAFTGEPVADYTREYSYDRLGWVTSYGLGTTTAWYSNIFTAAATEGLSAVGFYTDDAVTNYTVYIYTGVTAGQPVSGTMVHSVSGSVSSPGFYTVPVGYLALTAGKLFSVVVKATNSSSKYPIPVEANVTGYSGQASASGQSFVSGDGVSWAAAASMDASVTNVNLKAYAASKPPSGIVAVSDNLLKPLKNPAVKCKVAVTIFAAGTVTVKVYTMNGGFVKTIYNGPQNTGSANYFWDSRTDGGALVASGLYLIHIKGPSTDITEKAVVIK